jgi:hypothetical protein
MCKTPADYPLADPNIIQDPTHAPGPCNLADPSLVIDNEVTAPAMMAAFINATTDCDPPAARGGPGGPWPIIVGSVASGGVDLTSVPADWPMNIADFAELLLSTGRLAMIVHPGYGASTVDLTNGGIQNNLTGSVSIDYQTGGFNAQTVSRTRDMADVTNALWYLLGPHYHWWPQDLNHWHGSITPTAPNAGPDGDGGEPGDPWPPELVARWTGSQASYGYMQEIQIHDEKEDEQETVRPLFEQMYAKEAGLRAGSRTFTNFKPERATGTGAMFGVGDLIHVSAGAKLGGGGYSGDILVYEFEISIDADGVAEYTSITGSPDGQ